MSDLLIWQIVCVLSCIGYVINKVKYDKLKIDYDICDGYYKQARNELQMEQYRFAEFRRKVVESMYDRGFTTKEIDNVVYIGHRR